MKLCQISQQVFLGKCLKNNVLNFLVIIFEIMVKLQKHLFFTITHIYTFAQYVCSSLTEIQYLQVEPCEKGTHTNESMMLKIFTYLDSPNEQSAFERLQKIIICSFTGFLSLQLNEFLQSKSKQKLSSVQRIACITVFADEKMLNIFCVSQVLYFPSQSALQIKQFLQCVSIFSWNPQGKRKKANQR